MKWTSALAAIGILCLHGLALAKQTYELNVAKEGDAATAKVVAGLSLTGKEPAAVDADGGILIVNVKDFAPADVVVEQGKAKLDGTIKDKVVTFMLKAVTATEQLKVKVKDADVYTTSLTAATQGGSKDGQQGSGRAQETSLKALLATPCTGGALSNSKVENRVELLAQPNGNVFQFDKANIDEDDTIVVRVFADSQLVPYLRVRRASAFRQVGGINILGGDVKIPGVVQDHATGEATKPSCGELSVELRDFAPGEGTIEISAAIGADQVVLGNISVSIHPLYTGMFSLGGAWSNKVDPDFDVRSNGTDSVVTASESGDKRLLYTLFYTPFVWGKRDIEASQPFWHHVNPSVGLALNDPLNNVFLGGSVDVLNSVVLTAGVQVTRYRELTNGVKVGDPFSGTADQLPTTHRTKPVFFYGASVDLRAAVSLLQTVLGTAK